MIDILRTLSIAVVLATVSITGSSANATPASSPTLEAVKQRGYLNCGVSAMAPGFSEVDSRGVWHGMDVEFCSALASAIFGSRDAVKFRALNAGDQFKALAEGEVDVLMRASSFTLSRDTELGARFVGIIFFDGGGFLVPRNHSISSVLELSGASICVLPGSSGERDVTDYFFANNMRYQLVVSENWQQLVDIYAGGGCTALTGDVSLLAYERSRLANPNDHTMVPEVISKEPVGPAVRAGDDAWFAVVRWAMMALVAAEELGISQSNVADMKSSTVLDVRRFLGLEADLGAPLGLSRDWAEQIIRNVGNYAEIYERTFGEKSPLKLSRGLNRLWRDGGLMYAAPLR